MRVTALIISMSCAAAGVSWGQDADAFFTLVNTYAFTDGPRKGDRVLLKARQPFSVVDQSLDRDDVVWYQVVHPKRTNKIKGTGWVALDPHELNEKRDDPVLVFPVVLEQNDSPVQALELPASHLKLANVTQASETFPGVTWQKIDYESVVPALYWVRSPTGIYRPFKNKQFVSESYAEMVTRGVPPDRLRRLLSGVVRVGDRPMEVQWALGLPAQQEKSTAEELQIMIWHYPGAQVRFENEVVKQVN